MREVHDRVDDARDREGGGCEVGDDLPSSPDRGVAPWDGVLDGEGGSHGCGHAGGFLLVHFLRQEVDRHGEMFGDVVWRGGGRDGGRREECEKFV